MTTTVWVIRYDNKEYYYDIPPEIDKFPYYKNVAEEMQNGDIGNALEAFCITSQKDDGYSVLLSWLAFPHKLKSKEIKKVIIIVDEESTVAQVNNSDNDWVL